MERMSGGASSPRESFFRLMRVENIVIMTLFDIDRVLLVLVLLWCPTGGGCWQARSIRASLAPTGQQARNLVLRRQQKNCDTRTARNVRLHMQYTTKLMAELKVTRTLLRLARCLRSSSKEELWMTGSEANVTCSDQSTCAVMATR